MNDQEFMANLDYAFYVFFCNIIKVNHFLYCFITLLAFNLFFSIIRYLLVPYAYVSIELIGSILLSSFVLKTGLWIFSVKTSCLLLLIFTVFFIILIYCFLYIFMMFFNTIFVNFIFLYMV